MSLPDAAALNNEGVRFSEQQQLKEALECFNRALALRPLYVEALNNRAILLQSLRLYDDALRDLQAALRLTYNDHELYSSLATTLHHLWRLDDALAAIDKSIAIKPTHVSAHLNRGNILQSLKRYDEALKSYERGYKLDPQNYQASTNKVFTMDLMPNMGFEEHQAVRREWCERHVAHIQPYKYWKNKRNPDRKLTVGYISGDFRDHSASLGIRPVLQHHDHSQCNVVCYMLATVADEVSHEFQQYADKWVRCNLMDDDELLQQIRRDKVDILVELAGHTADQRLAVFARKPAPVQVTAWGYATGTGLPAIDYLFSDPVLIPPSVRHLYAEEVIDLPCAFSYGPRADIPDVGPLPYDKNGYITFGNYNRESKTSPECLAVWARILQAVPASRMIFKDNAFLQPARRSPIQKVFAEHGIDQARIGFSGKHMYREHMRSFDWVDIALDPFPHSGGISTWEPLWMGVPVVSKIGNSHPSRVSAAVLHALGMDGWVADNDDGYVALAVLAAKAPDMLRDFRSTIRSRLNLSSAGNPALYTREVEKAYRAMWRKWCEQQGARNGDDRRQAAVYAGSASGADLRAGGGNREIARAGGRA